MEGHKSKLTKTENTELDYDKELLWNSENEQCDATRFKDHLKCQSFTKGATGLVLILEFYDHCSS